MSEIDLFVDSVDINNLQATIKAAINKVKQTHAKTIKEEIDAALNALKPTDNNETLKKITQKIDEIFNKIIIITPNPGSTSADAADVTAAAADGSGLRATKLTSAKALEMMGESAGAAPHSAAAAAQMMLGKSAAATSATAGGDGNKDPSDPKGQKNTSGHKVKTDDDNSGSDDEDDSNTDQAAVQRQKRVSGLKVRNQLTQSMDAAAKVIQRNQRRFRLNTPVDKSSEPGQGSGAGGGGAAGKQLSTPVDKSSEPGQGSGAGGGGAAGKQLSTPVDKSSEPGQGSGAGGGGAAGKRQPYSVRAGLDNIRKGRNLRRLESGQSRYQSLQPVNRGGKKHKKRNTKNTTQKTQSKSATQNATQKTSK